MFDFLKYRFMCAMVSVILLGAGVFAYFVKGGFEYHIDFAGGAELQISFDKPVEASKLRAAINEQGWKDPVIQNVGTSGKEFLVKIGGEVENLEDKFKIQVDKAIPESKMTVEHINSIGSQVGKDTQWNAIVAVLLSLLLILLYVAIRSKYGYAMGAVVAIAHDMLAVLAFLLFFNEPISLNVLAAVLAILGYSLNDSIVIFSRVRENLNKFKDMPVIDVVNMSINQTMKRTLLTSFSTLLAVGSFFFLGGETLRGFSFAMLVGIVVGTYSSIYIASPVMLAFGTGASSKVENK